LKGYLLSYLGSAACLSALTVWIAGTSNHGGMQNHMPALTYLPVLDVATYYQSIAIDFSAPWFYHVLWLKCLVRASCKCTLSYWFKTVWCICCLK